MPDGHSLERRSAASPLVITRDPAPALVHLCRRDLGRPASLRIGRVS